MDQDADIAYTVALCDYPDLPERERSAAEQRYGRALERRLGSADGVAQTLRAMLALTEDGDDADASAQMLALRWQLANTAARQLGLQGLGEWPSAYFHVALR